jgi:hypothetical protein
MGGLQVKERKIMRLMLKIKNGTPPVRKVALRQITDGARAFGAGPLFNQILPLLMSPTVRRPTLARVRLWVGLTGARGPHCSWRTRSVT